MKHRFRIVIEGTIEDLLPGETKPLTEDEMWSCIGDTVGSMPSAGDAGEGTLIESVRQELRPDAE